MRTSSITGSRFAIILAILSALLPGTLIHAQSASWSSAGIMTKSRTYHTATLLGNGKVLLAGGFTDSYADEATAELYDPATNSWTATGNMTASRYDHSATLLADGRVLVVGGFNDYGRLSSAEIYDPATGKWTATGSMSIPRQTHGAALLPDGRVLVEGGCCVAGTTNDLNTAEIWDPATGQWTSAGMFHAPHSVGGAYALSDGTVLVPGGTTTENTTPGAQVDMYLSSGGWAALPPLGVTRAWFSGGVLAGDYVLVAGGDTGACCVGVNSAQLYNPATQSWTSTPPMGEKRIYGAAAVLASGTQILVAGGFSCCSNPAYTHASAEIFDLTTGSWFTTASMTNPRYGHTLTRLQDGTVLAAGGGQYGGVLAFNSAERYTPASTLTVSATGGSGQSAVVGNAYASPLSATVKDSSGAPVSGVLVTFNVVGSYASASFASGGLYGSGPTTTAMTNASGVATSTAMTANTTAGSFTVSTQVSQAGTIATFALTNKAGAAAGISSNSAPPQSAAVNTAFANRLAVTVRDTYGNLASGVTVTLTPPATGASGTFAGGVNTAVTDAAGLATSGLFTANGTTGSYSVAANVAGVSASAQFLMTNTPPAATAGSITATSGSGQSTIAGTAFASPLVATVKDSTGALMSGATVTFTAPAATQASGTFAGGGTTATAISNSSGLATSPVFTANTTTGSYAVAASVAGVSTAATFQLTNTAQPAPTITPVSGSASTLVNSAFANPLVANLKDGIGNPKVGVLVTFTAPATGASVSFTNGITTAYTDANGNAVSQKITANNTAGSYVITASAAGVTTPATFNMVNSVNAPASITATGGSAQSVAVNTAYPTKLSATVKDSSGNPLSNVTVTFTAPSSGASVSFGAGFTTTAVTNASGVATASAMTANTTAGAFSVYAQVSGVTTYGTFTLTNKPGAANSISATGGTPQSATVSTAFSSALSATVRDNYGNLVSGVTVTFTAPASGASGTFAGGVATGVTNASGVATSTAFTANSTSGAYSVTATAPGITSPTQFLLTNNAAATAASITATGGTPQTATVNAAFTTALSATVKNSSGTPMSGVTVTFNAPTTGASLTFAGNVVTAVTNASGVATSAKMTANTVAGTYVVTASVAGVATPASFAMTNKAGAASTIAASSGTPQSATVSTAFASPLAATVKDASGNPVSGVTVTFAAPTTGASGAFAGNATTAVTNASGVATSAVFTANATTGTYSVTAAVSGVTAKASFALTNNASTGSNKTLVPTSYVTTLGSSGGQAVSALGLLDESGSSGSWAKYVEFDPKSGSTYAGYQTFVLPTTTAPSSLKTMQIQVNYQGPASSGTTWTWQIYNWTSATWVTVGTNAGAPDWGAWKLLSFSVPGTLSSYVRANDGAMMVQLLSNNAKDSADVDYEAVVVTN